MSQVTLSSGEKVSFKEKWTHKADKVFRQTLKTNVVYKHDMEAGRIDPVEEIPAGNWDLAYESVLPLLVERVDKDGTEIEFSQKWLDDLLAEDYTKLEAAVYKLKNSPGGGGKKSCGN